jgi:hypothetical protein
MDETGPMNGLTPSRGMQSAVKEKGTGGKTVSNDFPVVEPQTETVATKNALSKNVLTNSKKGAINAKAAPKKSNMISTLEKVTEEGVDENLEPIRATNEPKKKKRKLLGAAKTLFDEEDAEATKRPTKSNLGPARSLSKGSSAGIKGGLGANMPGFGAFSPLKRDRRGAQASFLV